MHMLAVLLLAIATLFLITLLLGLFGLIGMEVHWAIRAWGRHTPDDQPP